MVITGHALLMHAFIEVLLLLFMLYFLHTPLSWEGGTITSTIYFIYAA